MNKIVHLGVGHEPTVELEYPIFLRPTEVLIVTEAFRDAVAAYRKLLFLGASEASARVVLPRSAIVR